MLRLLEIIQTSAAAFLVLYAAYALRKSWHDLRLAWADVVQQWKQRKVKEIILDFYLALLAIGPAGYLVCNVLDHFELIQI